MKMLVEFRNENYETKVLNFTISRRDHQKANLGGYIDMLGNTQYRNCYSQTDRTFKLKPQQFDRDTQMFDLETKSVTPIREFGSQTCNKHLSIDDRTSKSCVAQKYFDSELWLQRRIEATLFIQKMIRGFLARKRMSNIKWISDRIRKEKEALSWNKLQKIESAKLQEIEKRVHPKVS